MRIHEPFSVQLNAAETLRGDLSFTGQVGEHAIIYVHGFGSHRRGEKVLALAAECERIGWTFVAFDFRGHGESSGTMLELRVSRLLEDLTAIRDELNKRGVKRLYLFGSSMGAFASAWFAKQCGDVKACVFIAPAFRFLERRWQMLSKAERQNWRSHGMLRFQNQWIDVEVGYGLIEEREQYRFDKLIEGWNKPSVIFHGLADDTVPAGDSIDFINQVPLADIELRLIKDGDHRLNTHKEELAAEACRFFIRQSHFISS